MTTPALLLALLSSGTGPEVTVDPTTVPGPIPGDHWGVVSAAYDGGVFFAWIDTRASGAWSDIYVGRASTTGMTRVAPAGVGPGGQRDPAVACGLSTCAVVWFDNLRILARRFDFDAAPLDPAPVLVSRPSYDSWPTIAFSNGRYLVGWQTAALDVRELDEAGVLGPVTAVSGAREWPQLAGGESGFVLTSAGPAGLVTRFAEAGGTFGAGGVISTRTQYYDGVSIISSPLGFLVGQVATGPGALYVARLDDAGVPLDSPMLQLEMGAGPPLALAWSQSDYVAAWIYFTEVRSQRISATGVVSPSTTMFALPSGRITDVNLTSAPTPMLLYAAGPKDAPAKVTVHPWTPATDVIGPAVPMPASANHQLTPSAAFDGDRFLTVWVDERLDGGTDLRGRVLDEAGQPSGAAFDVATGPQAQVSPEVIGADGGWWVAWRESDSQYRVMAAFVSSAGVVGTPLVVSSATPNLGALALANGPAGPVVAFSDYRDDSQTLVTTRLLDGGVTPVIDLANRQSRKAAPAIASTFSGFLLANLDVDTMSLELRVLDRNGAAAQAPVVIPGGSGPIGVDVASNGQVSLVVWAVYGPTPWKLVGRRVDASGQPIDPAPLTLFDALVEGETAADMPSVSFDGRAFSVAFSRFTPDGGAQLTRVTVDLDGGVGAPEVITTPTSDDVDVVLAPATPGRTLWVYRNMDSTLDVGRVRARLVTAVPFGKRCLAAGECVAGLECLANVCCPPGGCPVTVVDAGTADGGEADAGLTQSDGGVTGDGRALRVGCGCGFAPGAPVLIAIGALLLRRRRRA